jgi:hypothetical protein
LGDRTLNRHQSLAEVLVNTEFYLWCCHKTGLAIRLSMHIVESAMSTGELYGTLGRAAASVGQCELVSTNSPSVGPEDNGTSHLAYGRVVDTAAF